ncbi:hypothetical protein Lalb_Chr16g0390431 [Lupinus albus]|uniref:Uncharacterized protein n=1 Tax=Lupinus albus TaxID=3870 RepID=A0A6A4PDR6_LUPAL|nr:hypothetical protein Lalb_Chr16g0390431 [Lupinus albus]
MQVVVEGTYRHKETFYNVVVEVETYRHMEDICKHVLGVICDCKLDNVHALVGYNGLAWIHSKNYNQQQH